MKITPEAKPMKDIFSMEGTTTYRIPVFQRHYSWHVNNIEELFNDIVSEDEGYYIGNMLVTPGIRRMGCETFSIVDGQQRLTTIALFFLAIYEYSVELETENSNNSEFHKRIGSLQEDIKRKLLLEEDINKPKLELLEKDQLIFLDHLRIFNGDVRGRYGNWAFGKRYNHIMELLRENIIDADDLFHFYKKVNHVEILRITAENISDAFSVFTSINSKGMPLTLIDLMKSTYLGQAINANVSEEDAKKKWDKLVNIFSDDDKNQNSAIITQFLLNNYDTFLTDRGNSLTKSKALKKYEKVFEKMGGHRYIDELIYNARIFSYISNATVQDATISFPNEVITLLESLKKLDSSQSYPLLMYVLRKYLDGDEKYSLDNIKLILNYLIKFYVRRNLSQKPKASNIRAKILETVRNIDHKDFSELLDSGLGSISVNDEEFAISLSQGLYDISPNTVRYVLIYLERENGREYFSKQNEDNLDQYMKTKGDKIVPRWTLEHILPVDEKLQNGWREMVNSNNGNNVELIHQENVHKIGNLTLTAYNPELSNKSFSDKVHFKVNESEGNYAGLRTPLYLNSSIPNMKENEKIECKDKWTIDDIERRTKILAEEIIKEFPL